MNNGYYCHKISGGFVEGEVLISKDDICFYLVEPETGKVIEKNHDLEGKSIVDKILIFPSGKGSSVVQGEGLYMLTRNNTGPKAMIIQHPDTVLVTGAIIMNVPLVDRVEEGFYQKVKNGDRVKVDADKGLISFI